MKCECLIFYKWSVVILLVFCMGISVFELIYIVDLLLNFNRILLEKEYVYDDVILKIYLWWLNK